jgi:hypothetical protein
VSRSILYRFHLINFSLLVVLSSFGWISIGDGDDLYQVAILVDQLKHDDVQLRINAFNNLERIGK